MQPTANTPLSFTEEPSYHSKFLLNHNNGVADQLSQKQQEVYQLLKEVSQLKDENRQLTQEKQQLRTLKDVLSGIPIEILTEDGEIPSQDDKSVVEVSIKNTLRLLVNGLEDLYAREDGFTYIMPLRCSKNDSLSSEMDDSTSNSLYLQLSRRGVHFFDKIDQEIPSIDDKQEITDSISTRRPIITGRESYAIDDPVYMLLPDKTLLLPCVIDSQVMAICGFPNCNVPLHLLHNIQEELQKVWISVIIKGDNYISDIQQRENLAKALEERNRKQNQISRELRELINKDSDPKKSFKATMTNYINYITLNLGGQTAGVIGVLDVEYNHAMFKKDILEEVIDNEDTETNSTAESESSDTLKACKAKSFIDFVYSDIGVQWATKEMSHLKAPRLKKMPFVKKFIVSDSNAEVWMSGDLLSLPKGHVPLKNIASIRVIYQNQTVAIILLSNFPEDSGLKETCRIFSQAVSGSWSDILNESLRKFEQKDRHQSAVDMLGYIPSVTKRLRAGEQYFVENIESAASLVLVVDNTEQIFSSGDTKAIHDFNNLYSSFDIIIRRCGMSKISENFSKFIAISLNQDSMQKQTQNALYAAFQMYTIAHRYNNSHQKKTSSDVRVRIAISTGPIVASIRQSLKKPTCSFGGVGLWNAHSLSSLTDSVGILLDGISYQYVHSLFKRPLSLLTMNGRNIVKIDSDDIMKPDFSEKETFEKITRKVTKDIEEQAKIGW